MSAKDRLTELLRVHIAPNDPHKPAEKIVEYIAEMCDDGSRFAAEQSMKLAELINALTFQVVGLEARINALESQGTTAIGGDSGESKADSEPSGAGSETPRPSRTKRASRG